MASTKAATYTAYELSAAQQQVKAGNRAGKYGKVPKCCVVTGGTGFVGQRLVETLVERGAERVVCFDIVPPSDYVWRHEAIEYVVGDLRDAEAVAAAVKGADCVWHNGAIVGPFHPSHLYTAVNVTGTANVIAACRRHGVRKLVFSSSPTTRFDGRDVDGFTEAMMANIPQKSYVQEYAKTKAEAECLVRAACDESLLTVAVAPHQVYGPRDNLFMPNLMEVAGLGKLRIFGPGTNRICFTHVDNYCHALILGERALTPNSPALGGFYIATDGDTHPYPDGYCLFWEEIDKAIVGLGFPSLKTKLHLPCWLMFFLGWICDLISFICGKKLKLGVFQVRMLTMNRWFRIDAIQRDLGYEPVMGFKEGWADTLAWFKEKWLPLFGGRGTGLAGEVASQTKRKIDIQAAQKVE